jgi:catechol 2,3-dioxygenase-like lactoylglutathione lyase family enzyme
MRLAKPRIDIGFLTNDAKPLLEFWQKEIGLPFDHSLPVRRGQVQHRHDLLGSVLKINEMEAPIPDRPPSGYRDLLIAREGLGAPRPMADPAGNRLSLVPKGTHGIERIGVRMGVRDLDAHRRYFGEALGLKEIANEPGRATFRAGDSIIMLEPDPAAGDDATFDGPGWRYITFQVFEVDREHAHVLAHGGREARAPVTLGKVARISMVRDPDGNWMELSQRASITGSLEVNL